MISVYLCFSFLGIGAYLTFFCMMASAPYWNYFYNLIFTTVASLVFNSGDMIGVFISPIFQHRIRTHNIVITAFSLQFLCIALLIPVHYISKLAVRYAIAQIIIAVCGLVSGTFMSTLNAIAAINGVSAVHGVQQGIGISEIAVQIVKLIFAALQPVLKGTEASQKKWMQFGYFGAALLFIVFQFICWFQLLKQIAEPDIRKNDKNVKNDVPESQIAQNASVTNDNSQNFVANEQQTNFSEQKKNQKFFWCSTLFSFSAIFCNYFTTYLVFPALLTAIPCYYTWKHKGTYRNDWWLLIDLTFYYFGDWSGRLVSNSKLLSKISLNGSRFTSFTRCAIFITLFCLVTMPVIKAKDGVLIQKPIIRNDYFSVILCFLFGFIGGSLVSNIFMKQLKQFDDEKQQKDSSNWLTIGNSTGCTISGVIGIFLAKVVQTD